MALLEPWFRGQKYQIKDLIWGQSKETLIDNDII